MRKVALAEWILSLTVAADRAATTVGDLVEDASTRGVVWFWSSVLWTALSHFWRDLNASPLRMIKLALWGCLAESVLGFLAITFWQSILNTWGPVVDNHTTMVPQWAYSLLGIIVVPLVVGWMVANLSHGRELAAGFAFNLLGATIYFSLLYMWSHPAHRFPGARYPEMESLVATFCVRPLFGMAGALSFRWLVGSRRLRVTEAN